MRLEQSNDAALRIAAARGIERGADLGRMMRVVVDDKRAVVIAEDLKAPVDAEELGDPGSGPLGADAELPRDGDRGERVPHVVLAGNEEFEEADAVNFERRAALMKREVARGEIGARPEAV